ncbi:uncharacterized protein LOC131243642 [Magnolia sinica]|uniref:uncharacterized protein LOC131243642 n=1 Tax=Magnolia sinica TaxID=86752 RepID=UPI00265A3B8B|nr:uncharacterized protein LOC131243642 [Magnolia sinica]
MPRILSRSPANSRLQFRGAFSQRQRSSFLKKPPEPLLRAVADCLSSSSSSSSLFSSSSSHHGNPPASVSEATAERTLRDYLANPSTIDNAYSVLLEHTLAEKDRSPAVVGRCVALLKRYLLRYVPGKQTLQQIDSFCLNSIAECVSVANRGVSPWLKSSSQHFPVSLTSRNTTPSLPSSNFASGALVKSLNYVRSLLTRHIPRQSFQPAAFAGAAISSVQSLPSLPSLLPKSFNSQLCTGPISSRESSEGKEISSSPSLNSSGPGVFDEDEDIKYIAIDALKWRWSGDGEQQSSSMITESDGVARGLDIWTHSFADIGTAALLVGDMEAKMKGWPWKYSSTRDISDLDKPLQPSTVMTATSFASSTSHLRTITAFKRLKSGTFQVWEDAPVGTFRPRARRLFQYRHYSEQQPLRLNPVEVSDVITDFCLEMSSPNTNLMTMSSGLTNHSRKPPMDVTVSVLVKLVIDMYVLDSRTAAPLTFSMLEEMLRSQRLASRVRAFDLILNLGVHAHLLEPMLQEDPPMIEEEEPSQEQNFSDKRPGVVLVKENAESGKQKTASLAIDNFQSWILSILHEILLLLVQREEREETIWSSALSCLLYLVCDRGKIWRNRLEGLDIRVIKVLLEISREHSWAEAVHRKLICMLTNMLYQVRTAHLDAGSSNTIFLVEQVDLLGGIEFICLEYSRANSREEKRNLFLVLFDYVLHQINEMCVATGGSTYSFDEIQPLATMLTLADAPEAFYIAVKHGVEGVGEMLERSISEALSRCPNFKCLNTLLEKITRQLDATISTFTCLGEEFSYMIHITKSYKSLEGIEDGLVEVGLGPKIKFSWATLHSLLHSQRSASRHNGYTWLVELLVSEISEEGNMSIWSKVNTLRDQIGIAGNQDSSTASSVTLPVSIMVGLLKSKHNFIRRGFLFVLEKLLMCLKLLLDGNKLQHVSGREVIGYDLSSNHLEEAYAVVDIMSSALSLVAQIHETDCINILKMCDMLFSQLCLRVLPGAGMRPGDLGCLDNLLNFTDENGKVDQVPHLPQQEMNQCGDEFLGNIHSRTSLDHPRICETASLAALLLRGHASVPMHLVERVPSALFYWPLIQLAGAATDDIALGLAVGSRGRGDLPGMTSDIRAALLLLLIGKCNDPSAFLDVGGEEFFRRLLDDMNPRVAYYSSSFLLKRMMTEEPEKYQRMLQSLVFKAQQSNNEKLLENPYLQMRGIIQLSNDLGTRL